RLRLSPPRAFFPALPGCFPQGRGCQVEGGSYRPWPRRRAPHQGPGGSLREGGPRAARAGLGRERPAAGSCGRRGGNKDSTCLGGARAGSALSPPCSAPAERQQSWAARAPGTLRRPGCCWAAARSRRRAVREGGPEGGAGRRRVSRRRRRVRLLDGARCVEVPPARRRVLPAPCAARAEDINGRNSPARPGRRVDGARAPRGRALRRAPGAGAGARRRRQRRRRRCGRPSRGRGRGACRTLDRSCRAAATAAAAAVAAAERGHSRSPPSAPERRDRGGRAAARIAEGAERRSCRLPGRSKGAARFPGAPPPPPRGHRRLREWFYPSGRQAGRAGARAPARARSGTMGTVLSLSPSYRKATLFEDGAATVGHYTAVQNSKNAKDKNLKRHSIISVLPWKRIVAVSAKKKNSKKVQPNSSYQNNITHLNNENLKKSLSCANLSTFAQPHRPSRPHPRPASSRAPRPGAPPRSRKPLTLPSPPQGRPNGSSSRRPPASCCAAWGCYLLRGGLGSRAPGRPADVPVPLLLLHGQRDLLPAQALPGGELQGGLLGPLPLCHQPHELKDAADKCRPTLLHTGLLRPEEREQPGGQEAAPPRPGSLSFF
uniref:Uncharacterized protein n=1 Tax=Macaca fascicularis TaxID=9541 RepID=A0A7N9DAI0_MACFA